MNGSDIDASAKSNNHLNLNRAVCNAAGLAETVDLDDNMSSSEMMQAIYLKEYVKSINDITPVQIPKPTFTSFLSSSKKPINEPLIHIKITHTAINHVDLLYAQGRHQNNHSGLFKPPFTLGLEFSGVVLAIQHPTPPSLSTIKSSSHSNQKSPPPSSSHFKPGDHVWGGSLGTHAEEIIVPQSAIRHVPRGWSLHDIAGLGAATAPVSYGALVNIANLQRGETILIHAAAGGLGIIAVQIARALGAKVIATVGSEAKAKVIRDLLLVDPTTGTTMKSGEIPPGEGVINYNVDTEWHKTVLSLTSQTQQQHHNNHDQASSSASTPQPGIGAGAGVDVVYDTVGLVAQSIRCTRFNGRIIIAGFAGRTGLGSSPSAALESIPTNRILLKQIKLLGYRYGETSRRLPRETTSMWTGLTEMLERREIRPVVYRTWKGLEVGIRQGMQALGGREVYGKAVVEVCPVEEAERYVEQRKQKQGESKDRREGGRMKAEAKL